MKLFYCERNDNIVEGDVLLYDLDASFHTTSFMVGRDTPTLYGRSLIAEHVNELHSMDYVKCNEYSDLSPLPETRFTIALSSHSVSRTSLEQLGAIALLQKPFEMGLLQRYLRILQRLLLSSPQEEIQARLCGREGKARILVVDDDIDVVYAIKQCLLYDCDIEPKYDVVVAHDGLEALEQYLDWQPQCIVTDLIMPWMNGYQIIRCLSAGMSRALPAFVVMSALTQLEVPVNRSYLEGKSVVYVNKPFQIDHLLTVIEQVCVG
jgi:CheY-like chemotaxis protein